MSPPKKTSRSTVEEYFLKQSNLRKLRTAPEKVDVIIVENFPALGKLTALRFIEWVLENPGGVISLPTGKTPEHFIKWVEHYLKFWKDKETARELESFGINPHSKPDMQSLHFIQIDEFYPINPKQHNSFYYYINEFYIEGFGLDPDKALLIDCSKIGIPEGESLNSVWPEFKVDITLRFRQANSKQEELQKTVLEKVDQWCQEYEDKIRALGGLGFFLGGIGPDGHIGF
ncbi:MAG: glucosamine-6-phosphate deaminase, partial [Calditrichia bacterium]|nr:glucosamine-6-phosphate deaminase [Calditrichia bacterium]